MSEGLCGLYPALVTDIVDPDRLGRIEVSLPALGEDGAQVRHWATLLTPYADDDEGFCAYPAVGSQVVVGFEAADPCRAYVVGACWNGVESAPTPATRQNDKKVWRTRSGSVLEFDDGAGTVTVTLRTASGHELVLDAGGSEIRLQHANGFGITLSASGSVDIVGNAPVTVTAPQLSVHAPVRRLRRHGEVLGPDHRECGQPAVHPRRREHVVSAVTAAPAAPQTLGETSWLLTAPWWHWEPNRGEAGAELRPALQKYASADLVTDFLADPQNRLAFVDTVDKTQPRPGTPNRCSRSRRQPAKPYGRSTCLCTRGTISSPWRCTATSRDCQQSAGTRSARRGSWSAGGPRSCRPRTSRRRGAE